jgi:hypothetical protein
VDGDGEVLGEGEELLLGEGAVVFFPRKDVVSRNKTERERDALGGSAGR